MSAVHRDASGLLHLDACVFGPWSSALHSNLKWFDARMPADVKKWHAMIKDGNAWFLRFEFLLPERPGKRPAMKLAVSSKTGAIGAPEIERMLLDAADGVLFVVDDTIPNPWQLDDALAMLAEKPRPVVVYQFDRMPYLETPEESHHTADHLRERLKVGDRPYISTRTWDGTGVTDAFALLVREMLAAGRS